MLIAIWVQAPFGIDDFVRRRVAHVTAPERRRSHDEQVNGTNESTLTRNGEEFLASAGLMKEWWN